MFSYSGAAVGRGEKSDLFGCQNEVTKFNVSRQKIKTHSAKNTNEKRCGIMLLDTETREDRDKIGYADRQKDIRG